MFCSKCGKELPEKTKFCTACGAQVSGTETIKVQEGKIQDIGNDQKGDASLVGFSLKINDPSFDKYKKESKSWSYIFSFILAIIAIIAFPIYGKVSGDIDWPYSLYYGFGIGGMFVLIAFFQRFKRNRDETWDGVVIDKQTCKKRDFDKSNDTHRDYIEYVFIVKRDNGKKYKHKSKDQPGLYHYYNIGDKVRHHKGFMFYEKYDKSKDKQIMCAACMSFNDIQEDFCVRCKRPLLK